MRKGLKRSLLSLGSLLLLLIVLLTATFLFWLGPTVKILAEKIGSKALGAPVSVEKLSINPRKGTLVLTGFEIGNHDVFGYSNTVSLAEVSVAIDIGTLFSDTIIIEDILIDSPHFVYEQNRATDNITEYITNLFAFAKIDPNQPKEPKPEPDEEDPDKEPTKVIVNQLRVTDVQMFLANTDDPDLDIRMELEEMTFSMSNGVVQLKNLTLSDPGLLTTPNLFTLESIDIKLDPESIYSDPIIIEHVQITKPYAYYEQNSETDTLAEFMKIVDSFTSKAAQKTAPPVDAAEAPEPEIAPTAKPPAPTVELRELVIDDIQLRIVNITHPELDIRLRLEQLALSPISGDVQLSRLTLSNPQRLATPNVFELDAIKIKLDPATLTNATVVIKDVQVIKPYAFLEQNPQTDTVTEFMRIAKQIATDTSISSPSATPNPDAPEPEKPVENESTPPPVELHNLFVDDIQIKFLDTAHANAPKELQTMASIGSISVKLVEGTLRIEAITIPNPAGSFTTTNLFHLPSIGITIDPESIFSDQVVIKEIHLDSPLINIEQTETTGNGTELQKIAEGFTPPPASKTPAAPTPDPDAETTNAPVPLAEHPIVLNSLIVTDLAVNMTTPTPTNNPATGAQGIGRLRPKNILARHSKKNTPPGKDFLTLAAFERLSVEPHKGLIRIANLQVGNPKGFADENLVTVEQFSVRIDPDSIATGILLIEDILIEKPRIAYERQLSTDNIKALKAFVESATQKREKSLSAGQESKPVSTNEVIAASDEEAGPKVIIAHLLVKNGKVRAKLSALPTAPIPLPNIEITDMGKEEGGASFSETSSKLYESFYDAIIGSVASVTGFAGDLLKGAGTLTFDALGTVTGGATDGLQEDLGLDEAAKEDEKKEEKKKKRTRHPGRRRPF